MTGPQESMKPQSSTEEESPRCILRRSYSARLPNQHAPSHQHSSRTYQNCYLQFQPDGSTRSLAISPNAVSFDEGIATNPSSGDNNWTGGSFRFDPSFEERHELPPRAPRKYRSHHPSEHFYHSTAPRHSGSVRSLMPSSGTHRPILERRNSGYIMSRNHHYNGGDRSGSFPREGDRPFPSKQLLRRPSLSAISSDPRSFSSSRSLVNASNKKSSKQSLGRRHKYTELDERDTGSRRPGPKPFHPQRSTSIYRKFDKKFSPEQDDDVWVERLILNGPNGVKKTCFKSLRGNITRNEPPTGASTIVYLEDIIVDKKGRPSRPRPLQSNQATNTESQLKPEVQAEQTQSQPEQSTLSTDLQNQETRNISAGTKTEDIGRKMPPKGQLKRRGSFFGFMKKSRKNKNGDAAKE